MRRRWDATGVALASLAFGTMIICALAQVSLVTGAIPRSLRHVERLEGTPVWPGLQDDGSGSPANLTPAGHVPEVGVIVLEVEETPPEHVGVVVTVNGKDSADFRFGRASVVVRRGDLIEARWGTPVPLDRTLTIRVVEASPNVRWPSVSEECAIGAEPTPLWTVKM